MNKSFIKFLVFFFLVFFNNLQAATPKDTLVVAWRFDDVLTLDPAEIGEIGGAEVIDNAYDRLITFDVKDTSKILPQTAKSWSVSKDGKTITFKIRKGIKFTSGNPLTAEDAAFSLQRVVSINKAPAFILNQFGFTKKNVKEKIKALDDETLQITLDKPYATSFVLYCLTSYVASIVDKKEVLKHEQNSDMGNKWLKTNYAGSGNYKIRTWKPSEVIILEGNKNHFEHPPKINKIILRHVPESSLQRILLEKGDVDMARNLESEQLDGIKEDKNIKVITTPKTYFYYVYMSPRRKEFSDERVRQAVKYAIDYDAINNVILKNTFTEHQTIIPNGFLGSIDDKPYKLNLKKARSLLKKAGYEKGFSIDFDVRNRPDRVEVAKNLQKTFAKIGIKINIIQADTNQVLAKFRARKSDMGLESWGPDYLDPNTNAQPFAYNPDNSENSSSKNLSWHIGWSNKKMSQEVVDASLEPNTKKREKMYKDLQRKFLKTGPFAVFSTSVSNDAMKKNVKGFIVGPAGDTNFYYNTTK